MQKAVASRAFKPSVTTKSAKQINHSVMALKSNLCTRLAPALKPSTLSCTRPLSLPNRASRTYQRFMPSAVAVTKGQEQFVDDKSQYAALQGVKVVCTRELAGQLCEEVVEQVKEKGIKLYLVSLGPPDRGTEFANHTGFPEDQLLADPESAVYEALSLHNSALDTFFNPKTPLALLDRVRKNGGKEIRKVMSDWKFWIPTKKGQSTQQGGAFIFKGETCVWQYFDPATAAHVNAQQLLKRALEIAGTN